MGKTFSSADEFIDDSKSYSDGVWDVLAGRSRWNTFISPNIEVAKKKFLGKYGNDGFKIMEAEAFQKTYKDEIGNDPNVGGVTLKDKCEIVLKESNKRHVAIMIVALHELVHWVSHPPEEGHKSTAKGFLDTGLHEGLTQVVAEDILADQGIAPTRDTITPERVAIVRKLIERFGIAPFGATLFCGQSNVLFQAINSDWGRADSNVGSTFQKLKILASGDKQKEAIELIGTENKAADSKKNVGPRRF